MVLAGVVVLVGSALLGVGSLVFGQQPVRADRAQLETALGTAAVAQEAYRADHGRFTTWRNDLVTTGWAPENAVDLRLVSATATTYCMAAGPVSGEPVMWRTPAGVSDEPCG
jgi:type II secretory pathway pseudopilin PulG